MSNPSHPESRVIETSISISAPVESVRSILLDFASYPSWCTFIPSISVARPTTTAPVSIGDTLNVTISPPGGSAMTISPKVVHLDSHGLGWQGHLANINGLFDGKHLFLLQEEADGKATKLVHREEFGGILYTPLMSWLGIGQKTKAGFESFNQSLKKRAEQDAPPTS